MTSLKKWDPFKELGYDVEYAIKDCPEEIVVPVLSITLARCIMNSKNYVKAYDASSKIIIDSLNYLRSKPNGG